ncbi:MAG: hypothetical protein HN742_24355 [Lentisphaerae bacterium]|jgi:hypothetical protein|nr:hypothetical protein [Lentisphaerota bacterium]MBT4819653.1 hypothetical protein [Lentisphaerota bacterium]MBT5608949.1 hypothetical protein [Lentisphaerota bacterium]MBT7061488.1 hypothetical protein [Lentisphaerota bacterium]MBT7845032.1 hypothetical protein [Lentisphaerota bacterium]
MFHDWYSAIHDDPTIVGASSVGKRQKLALDVFSDDGRDEAKENARKCSSPWFTDGSHSYEAPADGPLPTTRSIAVKLEWTLTSPFFSRAESEFDAIDNPISRDRLTGYPILKATGAKGMMAHLVQLDDEALWQKLFGRANDQDGTGDSGRAVFGDVVFDKVDTDIFSPHDRQHGVVDHPVGFEVVPTGAKATWGFLLFERVCRELEILSCLEQLLETARDLICEYGMSAKRTVGYGMGKEIHVTLRPGAAWDFGVEGQRIDIVPFDEPEPEKPTKAESLDLPKHHEALMSNGRMACERSEAAGVLTDDECRRRGLTRPKQRGKVSKGWIRKDKATKLWDDCRRILDAQTSGLAEESRAKQQAHDEWARRKVEWENSPDHRELSYAFTDVAEAIQAICAGKEVAQ